MNWHLSFTCSSLLFNTKVSASATPVTAIPAATLQLLQAETQKAGRCVTINWYIRWTL